MIPEDIEDRYDIVQILQETAATAVLLVNYRKIGALRVLKAVHSAHPDAHSILSEAHLLQGIKSSQVPTIFSVEDTNEMNYLVEEYVEGQSLREYLLDTIISKEKLIKIAISLCDVIEALHNADGGPILYRDMKPEHVILQENTVRLIDFGISVRKSEAAKARPLGTINWAAPEQLKAGFLDERCDVYGVGKIIEFMQKNSNARDDFRIKKLVSQATEENIENRIKSISELKQGLLDLQGNKAKNTTEVRHLCKRIAVVGAAHAVGTTKIAINICRFLNKRGLSAYYKNEKDDVVHNLLENLSGTKIKDGILYHDYFKGILNYGDAVEKYMPPIGLYIVDCGIDLNQAINSDLIIMITGTAPWQRVRYPKWIRDKSVLLVANMSTKIASIRLAKELKKKVYMYPPSKCSGDLSKEEERIIQTLLQNEKDIKF
ncbi:Protein kinase domain-containing protein [Pseudobutyrivibrio sp. OR37]|uniref:serine/threonine-protein kinase n=1 Tax=Pseudobutyrivibrio sp. OR37 TaxID=1798186 RepID=UPI0008F390EA|nr:protein kinase [Pseudobutyrivibrio sp. OR37]SFH83190.1 Protein kinase domain-containing protein [Pseudobutyrivibrio sp. OR37]